MSAAPSTVRPIHRTAAGPESPPDPVPVPGRLCAPATAPVGVRTGVRGDAAVVGVPSELDGVELLLIAGVDVPPAEVDGVVYGVWACDEPALQTSPNVISAAPTTTPPAPARIELLNFKLWPPSHELKSS